MTTDDKISDEKLEYDMKKKQQKLINMNILQMKNYYPQIKKE